MCAPRPGYGLLPMALRLFLILTCSLGALQVGATPRDVGTTDAWLAAFTKGDFSHYHHVVDHRVTSRRSVTIRRMPGTRHPIHIRSDVIDPGTGTPRRTNVSADWILVGLNPGVTETTLRALSSRLGVDVVDQLHPDHPIYRVAVADQRIDTVPRTLRRFRQERQVVRWAEPDQVVYLAGVPDDPRRRHAWHLSNDGFAGQQTGYVSDEDIDAFEAWQVTTGSTAVTVGVVDTGIDYLHPDLAPNMWINRGEIPDNGIDDDNNGKIDDYRGWGFCAYPGATSSDPMDDVEHGTLSAGLIGAVGNNGIAASGVNWAVSMINAKVAGLDFRVCIPAMLSSTLGALAYMLEFDAAVVALDVLFEEPSTAMSRLFTQLNAQGTLVVAAAGNSGVNIDDPSQTQRFPSAMTHDNLISVAATNQRGTLAGFSSYGVTSVDLAAPGTPILSTGLFTPTAWSSGTSFAQPIVAGAAALLFAHSHSAGLAWTHLQIKERLLASVDPHPSLQQKSVAGGRVNVFRALRGSTATAVVYAGHRVADDGGGNGDNLANPGEVVDLVITIENKGGLEATAVTAMFAALTPDPRIQVLNPVQQLGTIAAGAATVATYRIAISGAMSQMTVQDVVLTTEDGTGTRWQSSLSLPIGPSFTLAPLAATFTTVVDLNNAGWVVGQTADTAILWNTHSVTTVAVGQPALALNQRGDVLTPTDIWSAGGSIPHQIPYPVSDINNERAIAGHAHGPGFVWINQHTIPLGVDVPAVALNENTDAVGGDTSPRGDVASATPSMGPAFHWHRGTLMQAPATRWGSTARGINERDQIVGVYAGELVRRIEHVAVRLESGLATVLPTFGCRVGIGLDLTNDGLVLGNVLNPDSPSSCFAVDRFRPALWRGNHDVDPSARLTAPGWQLREAEAINDAGQVLGYGSRNGGRKVPLLLTPSGLRLFSPLPGTAAGSSTRNLLSVIGATPGERLVAAWARDPGHWQIASCDHLAAGLADPVPFAVAIANQSGTARLPFDVPGTLAGTTVWLQVWALDTCRLSNLLAHRFPSH